MKVKIRFASTPFFNFQPDTLAVPGVLVPIAEDKMLWTLAFTRQKQLSDFEFIGELRWMVDEVDDDLIAGRRFFLVSNIQKFFDSNMTQGFFAEGEVL